MGPPYAELTLPRIDLDVEVRAPGYETIRVHLKADELAQPGEIRTGRAFLLRRDS
jgi:hypothetical protein